MNNDAIATAEKLARDFLGQVWGPKHEIDLIDELMTGAEDEILDVFASTAGDRVVARWINRGRNNGVFGLPADGRLAECWIEREAPRYRH